MQPALYRPRLFDPRSLCLATPLALASMQLHAVARYPSQTLSYSYFIPITCITRQIFRKDRTVSTPKRAKHCVSARLYTDSRRAAVDAVNGAEALTRATVLCKDSGDGE